MKFGELIEKLVELEVDPETVEAIRELFIRNRRIAKEEGYSKGFNNGYKTGLHEIREKISEVIGRE